MARGREGEGEGGQTHTSARTRRAPARECQRRLALTRSRRPPPALPHPLARSGYAHGSYRQVCGEGHGVEGDAVVPVTSALLDGAEAVVVDGVFHRCAGRRPPPRW